MKRKLTVSYVCLIVFPLFIISIISFNLYSDEIQRTVIKSSVQSNESINKNLDTFLGMLSKLSEYPVKNKEILNLMTKDYSGDQYPEYEQSEDKDTIKEHLYYNIKTHSDMIDSVILYKSDFEIFGRTPRESLNAAYNPSQEQWFKSIEELEGGCAIVGIHRDFQQSIKGNFVISVGRAVIHPDTGKNIGCVIINVRADNLDRLWMDAKLTENSKFYLIDENNNVVFSGDKSILSENIEEVLGQDMAFDSSDDGIKSISGKDYYFISSKSKLSKWTVLTVIPQKELFSYINTMSYITLSVGALICILSVIIAIFIASSVTKPLHKLNLKMKQVGKGNFDVTIDEGYGEVGEIGRTVQKMMEEIKRLINEIYREEGEKRNAEMNALQAQINPHFLYNTLNTIKWMANMQGAKSIETALGSLSSLFSFIAKSNSDFIPIRAEIMFIQEYLSILSLRYYNRFFVSYEIDEEVYGYKTLKFLLQPVIENAIFHGIEGVDRKGLLKISAYKSGNRIVFVVEDNGKGIENEVLQSIFKEDEDIAHKRINSIGIPNIQKRVKLFFGEDYGLSIKSEDEHGTQVKVSIPAIPLDIGESL